jgi:predicted nuclease of predicted toxin-antitoxin system
VKLLFDENLSPKLVQLLAGDFPGSVHVHDIGLGGADDKTIWRHAADNGFLIVSKDSDFHGWSTLYAFPPKVIWLWTGNCSTGKIANLLRSNAAFIAEFRNNERDSCAALAFKHIF